MEQYILWVALMTGFLIIEGCTYNLVTIWFACGALFACIAKLFGAPIEVQWIVFAAVTAVSLVATRPLVKRYNKKNKISTNADRFVGQRAVVTDDILHGKFAGKVKVGGQEWSAVTDDGSEIESGASVCVKDIQGVKLVVHKE